jgi:hypothetical protein
VFHGRQARKPTELLEAAGTFRPDRHAARDAAPKSSAPIGDPPPELAPDAAECWRELVAEAAAGVLTGADRGLVELGASWGRAGCDGGREGAGAADCPRDTLPLNRRNWACPRCRNVYREKST